MTGAARENLTLFMTVALDRNALSDVCGLNLQYHYKTVSRQSKVYSVGPKRRLWQEKKPTSETVLQVNSFIRGNQKICTPEIGDEYELKREPLKMVDHNAVAIVRKREKVGGLRGIASTRMN